MEGHYLPAGEASTKARPRLPATHAVRYPASRRLSQSFVYLHDLMQDQLAIDTICEELERNLPATLHYHSAQHTLDVLHAVEVIGKAEGISEEDQKLLRVATAYHDAGFLNTYENHEDEGIRMVKERLPGFGFSDEQIDRIAGMIKATQIPQQPKNHLEKIIGDADLYYLGGDYYHTIARGLFRELQVRNPKLQDEIWLDLQINFLEGHQYWTRFCQEKRDAPKKEILAELKKKKEALSEH